MAVGDTERANSQAICSPQGERHFGKEPAWVFGSLQTNVQNAEFML